MGTLMKHTGDPRGIRGDPRGIRWGSAGDPPTFWGIRTEKGGFWFEFQGDPFETTAVFYNITEGLRG